MTRERKFKTQIDRRVGKPHFNSDYGFWFSDDINDWQRNKRKTTNDEIGIQRKSARQSVRP